MLTTFCDLAVAPRPALAPLPLTGKRRPCGEKPKLCGPLQKAGNQAVRKYWTRVKKDIDGKLLLLVFDAALSMSAMLRKSHCVCRQVLTFFALCHKGNKLDSWVLRAAVADVCEESPALAALLQDPKQEKLLKEHMDK